MIRELETDLRDVLGDRLKRSMPLAGLTSFRIGGPADLFAEVDDEAELRSAIIAAHRRAVPILCLGSGTNLLVSDRGVRGLVVSLGADFSRIEIEGATVVAGAAVDFRRLVEAVVESGLRGLEFGEGIPGTVGGALVMNAGAFGGEMARVVTAVHGLSVEGSRRTLPRERVGFAYRRTQLPPHFVITRVNFELTRGDPGWLAERTALLRDRRARRQPKGFPNAGSVFRNPPGGFAGRLLEGAGLKGVRCGRAAFSCRHANFIVNLGGARAADVRLLIEMARTRVRDQTGVWLEPEVRLVGEW